MSPSRQARRLVLLLLRTALTAVAATLVAAATALLILQTTWAKERLRRLVVAQANEYLTASLDIGRLRGSIVRGVELDAVRLTRHGRTLATIDQVSLAYSIRELLTHGTVIRELRLVRPEIRAARNPDGTWNLAGLVRRPDGPAAPAGRPRPLEITSLDVVDGSLHAADPIKLGPAYVPADVEHLRAALSLAYGPSGLTIAARDIRWEGHHPDLTVRRLSGTLGIGPRAITFDRYAVETPAGAFTLNGAIDRQASPHRLNLEVQATRFDFKAWGGVLHGLSKIDVAATFDVKLRGPVRQMETAIDLRSTGGSARGTLVLDATVPGWHGRGTLLVDAIDLARWLSKPEKRSDISGAVTFNLALELGRHFPRGSYEFAGPHAAFMGYAGSDVRARGTLTRTEALVSGATARAYGGSVTIAAGAIGLDAPFPYHFTGTARDVDLRRLPASIPLPHVESTLAFDYDVRGRFRRATIAGRARFAPSTFLGARLGAGTVGSVDTSATPLRYAGEGTISGFDVNRVGRGLDVAWMQDPRYAGSVSGHFQVEASGAGRRALALSARGRIATATLFSGVVRDADVTLDIAGGTLSTTFDGRYAEIDPAVALGDPRVRASLTGSADVRARVADLLLRTPGLLDYTVGGSVALQPSTLRGVDVTGGRVAGELAGGAVTLSEAALTGPAVAGHGAGVVSFVDTRSSDFQYTLDGVDLAKVAPLAGRRMAGTLSGGGRLTGTPAALRAAGDAALRNAALPGLDALAASAHYDLAAPWGRFERERFERAAAALEGRVSFAHVAGVPVDQARGTLSLAHGCVAFDASATQAAGRTGSVSGAAIVHPDRRQLKLADLTIALGAGPWRLAAAEPPTIDWSGPGVSFSPITLAGGPSLGQQITLSGAWGGPAADLHLAARNVHLETLEGAFERPARYGGTVDLDATLRGTGERPIVAARLHISDGRIRRLTYNDLVAEVDYHDGLFHVAFRLDQAPGVWMRANGTVPLALVARGLPPRPIDVTITSSPIDLGLIEGVTDVVRDVGGRLNVNVRATGTSDDPHFTGSIAVDDARFLVAATGVRYRNGRAAFRLSPDRIQVERLHLEDEDGDPLDITGSLAAHELKIGAVTADMTARHLSVIHNALGDLETNATLAVRGTVRAPRVSGRLSLQAGAVHVDRLLEQLLFHPYSTEEAAGPPAATASAGAAPPLDALAALNPWDRLALAVNLRVPETLRLTGEDIQITPGTPIGLGSINLHAGGDLWLIKEAAQPLGVYGSLDSLNGTYGFQGRQFEIQPGSSINFRGDVTPDVYVGVARQISGVLARVTIAGPLKSPELQLTSTPPLDPSDVFALVVFGTSANQLNASQQQELAVRAGALAAGFVATPIVSALEGSLGLALLEIEPAGEFGTGPKITVGQELAPGLVARFSRQFGPTPYDQATIEYFLSRILQIRATFSDAASLNTVSPFRRIERAGIDLVLFFSY